MDILVINLNERPNICGFCGKEHYDKLALPVSETGYVVSDDYQGKWVGVSACKGCFENPPESFW